jgi:hypothetical protein
MELQNLPESVANLVKASDIIECGSEKQLLAAVKEAGYWLDNVEYPDIDSGSVSSLITYKERREFAQRWADDIDTVVGEDYLNLEGIENLDDAYARYCQAAVSWAYSQLDSTMEDAANISPEMLKELVECAQNAQEMEPDDALCAWREPRTREELIGYGSWGCSADSVVSIWLNDLEAEVLKVREGTGDAAGVMLVGDGRAIWFPDASHRHA